MKNTLAYVVTSLLIFAALNVSAKANASEYLATSVNCDGPSISTLSQGNSAYVVKYQILRGTQSDAPVLVYLQGGPGGTAILPEDTPRHAWTEIRMDMPGTGCSVVDTHVDPNTLDLSTDNFVNLWTQLIRQLKITHLNLQGRSYGTQVATQLASKLEAEHLAKVDNVILEGTTGPAGKSAQWADGFIAGWERLRWEQAVLLAPASIDVAQPFGVDSNVWAKFAIYALSVGATAQGPWLSDTIYLMSPLAHASSTDAEKKAVVDTLNQVSAKMHALVDSYLYQRLSCEESNPSGIEYNLRWNLGHLAYPAQGFCAGKPWSLSRPYDPKNYSYTAPTIYIEGGLDPNTPLGGKLYHMNVQTKSVRTLVLTKLGGHGILEGGILDGCKEAVVQSILSATPVGKATFNTCGYTGLSFYSLEAGETVGKFPALQGELESYVNSLKISPQW